LLGLSSESIAAKMNAVMSGAVVTQVRDGIYLVDVMARATDEQRVSLSTLRKLQFPLPSGPHGPPRRIRGFGFRAGIPFDLAP
jgi:multidrug efflux pump